MSDKDDVLGLLDDLLRLAEGSAASVIEVEADGLAVALVRAPQPARAAQHVAASVPSVPQPTRVHASTVGIFSASKDWSAGDAVEQGTVLGAIQSLGAIAEVTAPIDGVLRDVLVAGGAPVEYGQPLFAIEKR
ncbi:MAG TPA: biotin/lipoyl-containing protein [Candidatus Limnocylindria bacterium]